MKSKVCKNLFCILFLEIENNLWQFIQQGSSWKHGVAYFLDATEWWCSFQGSGTTLCKAGRAQPRANTITYTVHAVWQVFSFGLNWLCKLVTPQKDVKLKVGYSDETPRVIDTTASLAAYHDRKVTKVGFLTWKGAGHTEDTAATGCFTLYVIFRQLSCLKIT